MKFLSKRAASAAPYIAGEQPQDKTYLKLNTNENPYAPSPSVTKVLKKEDPFELRKYPDPDAKELKAAIAEAHGVKSENVFVGNGSDEVLAFAFAAFFDEGDRIAFADYTYSFYPVYADFFGVKKDIVPLREFRLIKEDYFGYTGKGILICNPNAPTGIAVTTAEIESILLKNPEKLVVVDEAYADFAEENALPLLARYPNLLLVRTFSKSYALAGVRLGYALGAPELVACLERVKNSFNSYTVDRLTQKIGIAAISDGEYFLRRVREVVSTRKASAAELSRLGFRVLPSQTNFLFVETGDGKRYYEALKRDGILVRYFDKPVLNRFLRVTVGTDEEMARFVRKMRELKSVFETV